MGKRLFLIFALGASAHGCASDAQARCAPQFHPFNGDARLICTPDLWERHPAYGPLRSHHYGLQPPDATQRA